MLGYQHIFWFYSHPAVYIMMLPGFGIISEVIAVMSRKPIFGYRLMALSLMAILVLGFSVWAHHMFVAGMAPWLRVPMMVTSMLIAVPDRDQGVLLAGDDVGGQAPLPNADAVRARLPLDVRARRPLGHLPRVGADRHRRLGHVLHRRAHPLRALRRLGLHDLRRDLLLVPEDDRPDVRRAARQAPLLAHVHRLQRHLLPDALGRAAGDAAPGRRLRLAVRRLEHLHLDLLVHARRVDDRLLLQRDRQLGPRARRALEPVARAHARVAGHLAAAGLQLRRDPAGRRQPVRVRRPGRQARGAARRHERPRRRRGACARRRSCGERRAASHPRRRQRDADGRRAARRRAEAGRGRRRARDRDRAGERAARGVRRLREHAPRLRGPPARPDAHQASARPASRPTATSSTTTR